ncbi:MAG TPA: site-specific DNA-methyltransferase, partial [Anaerolineae bacterium]|nr:site-specific DNA-methyltransferase [Anaerolineae bacterium]
MDHLARLQEFFRSLFQFDLADLDFGLYRLFRIKQDEIEAFITAQLPREVDAAFAEVSAGDKEYLEREIERLTQQIQDNLTDDAILPGGEIAPAYADTRVGRAYTEARRKLRAIEVTEGHKAEVFNHLVTFFSRYYEEGDFIPRRRYGARETYAVPYRGEEVFFHWANRDQHYVKTHERFLDYAFTVRDLTGAYRVRFTIAAASVPRDNTKGSRRYFFPRPDSAAYDADSRAFTLPFEYRLPTPEEAGAYGSNSQAQEAILEEAVPRILEAVPDENLRALLGQDQRTEQDVADGKPEMPLLLRRLRHFCRRNTSDYFIHRDLRGFLTRELEFYIKDQVLHLMDLEADLDAKRRVVRT